MLSNGMPIYEYECAKCRKTIEVIQKMSDKPLKKHEKCGGSLTKLISAAGFQFKGTGWYVTDYRKDAKGDSKEGKEAKEAKEATDSKADSKSDSKKETKETSSNGNKEGASAKAGAEKSEKKDTGKKDTGKSGAKKD
jgi:putative FmdB family regulatory protein